MIYQNSPQLIIRLSIYRYSWTLALTCLLGLAPRLLADGPPPPAPLPGPLMIVGGGGMPPNARELFVNMAGKSQAKIIVIPTASGGADNPKEAESFLKAWRAHNPASVVLLHTRDRKQADNAAFVKPLTEATGVWFSGGDQSRVTAAYKGTLVEKELHKLHARGGVLGGTSAGAAIMSDPMITGGSEKAGTGPGFGFLPGCVVDQHFVARNRQKRLSGVIAAHPNYVGFGIDEGTALVCKGRDLEVIGKSTVTVLLAAGAGEKESTKSVKAGDHLDLIECRNAAAKRAAKGDAPASPAVQKP